MYIHWRSAYLCQQTLKNTRQNIKEIAKIYFFLSFYVWYKMYRLGDETDSAIR